MITLLKYDKECKTKQMKASLSIYEVRLVTINLCFKHYKRAQSQGRKLITNKEDRLAASCSIIKQYALVEMDGVQTVKRITYKNI
jgi:Asp/Glu/hydantoin racemase